MIFLYMNLYDFEYEPGMAPTQRLMMTSGYKTSSSAVEPHSSSSVDSFGASDRHPAIIQPEREEEASTELEPQKRFATRSEYDRNFDL